MIEVERKFRPTEEQLNDLLKDCEFLKEVVNHDIIYDYPDYRLINKSIRLRLRNGKFELKTSDDSSEYASLEIEDEEKIKKYFNTTLPIKDFVEQNLIEGINIKTIRKKYKKGDFIIDIDELDFGYKCVEIELLVEDKKDVKKAYEQIIKLAQNYHFDIQEVPPKKKEYFRIVKPEIYKLLYKDK